MRRKRERECVCEREREKPSYGVHTCNIQTSHPLTSMGSAARRHLLVVPEVLPDWYLLNTHHVLGAQQRVETEQASVSVLIRS